MTFGGNEVQLLFESVESGNLMVNHIPTGLQLSDLLTKNPPKPAFTRLRAVMQSYNSTHNNK